MIFFPLLIYIFQLGTSRPIGGNIFFIPQVSDMVAVILYLLAKNPQAQMKVQEEIDRVLGDGVDVLTPKHLNQLSYIKAVVKEANR